MTIIKERNIKFRSFYGQVNETMKNEALLPIEINIPKRFSSEGDSNILHQAKMLSFYVWMNMKRERKISWFVLSCNGWEKTAAKISKEEVITSNNWKHWTLV